MPVRRNVLDNRAFLLGLDELYKFLIKSFEREELLACARKLVATLKMPPVDVPIEGYYAEDDLLTEYFRLMRALQSVDEERVSEIENLQEYWRLKEVTSAPIFGSLVSNGKLLSGGRDPLARALDQTKPDWALDRLVKVAYEIARDSDDISLVGVAALTADPVSLAAIRESVALYSEVLIGSAEPQREEIEWRVDEIVVQRAMRFVDGFRHVFGKEIPEPVAENAGIYWMAYQSANVAGRCVCLGVNDSSKPAQYYYWAIRPRNQESTVHDFWSSEIWTTERYRRQPINPLG